MSGAGAPSARIGGGQLSSGERIPDLKVAVIAASWHDEIMGGLIGGALRAVDAADLTATLVRVPGTVELTVAAARAVAAGFDAVVVLGVVIRGGTPHFDYVCQSVTSGVTEVCARSGIPIGFGVLTCDDEGQARARAGLPDSVEDKGFEAAEAAIVTATVLATWPTPQ